MVRLSDEERMELFGQQLPDLRQRRPDLEPVIYNVFLNRRVQALHEMGIEVAEPEAIESGGGA